MIEARNNGIPLIESVPKAAITQSLIALSKTFSSDEPVAETEAKKPRSGLFKLWSGKKEKG